MNRRLAKYHAGLRRLLRLRPGRERDGLYRSLQLLIASMTRAEAREAARLSRRDVTPDPVEVYP